MKKYVPKTVRIYIRRLQVVMKDMLSGRYFKFAKKKIPIVNGIENQVVTRQLITQTPLSENKCHNLRTAAKKIHNITIQPGKIVSFWHLVGRPTVYNGFKSGRCIINDKLTHNIGGGLCQLSGILYYCSLKAGLDIIERHPHSHDLYKDENRYAPLGSDATVVYGYKDLRILNNYHEPISFNITVEDHQITVSITSSIKLNEYTIEFKPQQKEDCVTVETCRYMVPGKPRIMAYSNYPHIENTATQKYNGLR